MTTLRRSTSIYVILPWAASLLVHGCVAAALLQYYSQPNIQPNLPVMELVQLPVVIAPPAQAPEPLPVQPSPPRKPPPVARPKSPAPVPDVTERIVPVPLVEASASPEPPPPVIQTRADPTPALPEPEPVVDLQAAYLENPRPSYPASMPWIAPRWRPCGTGVFGLRSETAWRSPYPAYWYPSSSDLNNRNTTRTQCRT